MGGPKNLGKIIQEQNAFNSDQAVSEVAKKKKEAESKGYTFKGPLRIDESGGEGKGNVSTSGIKKGNQVTKTETVKAPKAVSGGTPGTPWENKMKSLLASGVSYKQLAKEGHGYEDALKKKFPNAYVPKTVTTGTPDENIDISVPYEEKAAEDNSGELATDTGGDDDKKKDKEKGKWKEKIGGLLAKNGGTKGNTRGNRTNTMPTSTSPSGSNPKDFGLNLNNQAVNKA